MPETLPAEAVQEWVDNSDFGCGECGSQSLFVVEMLYEPLYEEKFEGISPQLPKFRCDVCGEVTKNSLRDSAVEEIRSELS